jgi:hypothetical protein
VDSKGKFSSQKLGAVVLNYLYKQEIDPWCPNTNSKSLKKGAKEVGPMI